MGNALSVSNLFSCALEIFMAVSSGIVGVGYLVSRSMQHSFFRHISAAALTTVSLAYIFQNEELVEPSKEKVIFITGCDSGLGFSFAQHLCDLGFTIIAGFLNLKSEGAMELRKICGNKIRYVHLDLVKSDTVTAAVEDLEQFLFKNPSYGLWALINNAGVMVFGEFEWQTEKLVRQQIDVNLLGSLRITNALCPLLRKYKGRIITVTSHCAQQCLPGLSVYGATKAGLSSWNDGIRIELQKYGVKVINFIPGSFIQQSNIMACHRANYEEMYSEFSSEQKAFYGEFFKRYNHYLDQICKTRLPRKIDDVGLYEQLEKALLHVSPRAKYVNEALNYKLYHLLFKFSPTHLRDLLVIHFVQMPKYESANLENTTDSN